MCIAGASGYFRWDSRNSTESENVGKIRTNEEIRGFRGRRSYYSCSLTAGNWLLKISLLRISESRLRKADQVHSVAKATNARAERLRSAIYRVQVSDTQQCARLCL